MLKNAHQIKNMGIPSMLCLGFSIFFLMTTLQAGLAATFYRGGDESMNCVLTVEGQIVSGDAQRFREFLRVNFDLVANDGSSPRYGEQRICLDSPGGSFVDAIAMADLLVFGLGIEEVIGEDVVYERRFLTRTLGTAIPPGAE